MRFFLTILMLSFFLITSKTIANEITLKKMVTIRIGQSIVVKGVRPNGCDNPTPPTYLRLPKTSLGTFSTGKTGMTKSRRCGKKVPAREVVFTAKQKGKETFEIYLDKITIRVK